MGMGWGWGEKVVPVQLSTVHIIIDVYMPCARLRLVMISVC